MKLTEEADKSSLSFFSQLIDKSKSIEDRLKLARSIWDLSEKDSVINKHQFIVNWTVDLLTNKKQSTINESDLIQTWEVFYYFLCDFKLKSNPISNGLVFVQTLLDTLNTTNRALKDSVNNCCDKLFRTKFSHYLTKNFDQMTRLTSHYLTETNQSFSEPELLKSSLGRVHLVLEKYYACLKSQQNQNRLFNRLCTQIFFNILNLITNVSQYNSDDATLANISDLSWKIIKNSLLSKSFSNIYMEFFKNLPASFSTKSNYQVAVLFTTIQNESNKTNENFFSICSNIHLITRELFLIMNHIDYKLKMTVIQFIVDLIWDLNGCSTKMEVENGDEIDNSESRNDSVIKAVTSLFGVVDELNMFNLVDDQASGNLFKNWAKGFIKKTIHNRFNENYSNFLIQLLKIDHTILETDLNVILANLQNENNLEAFLVFYLNSHVKFRQLLKVTNRLIESIEHNENLKFPVGFYVKYAESMENYNVDIQTIVNCWKSVNKQLESSADKKPNLRVELHKMLSAVLSRVNLTNQRFPLHLKTISFELLNQSRSLLESRLLNLEKLEESEELIACLDCYYTCGFLFLIAYRFSITGTSQSTSTTGVTHSASSLNDLNLFLANLNDKFKLRKRIEKQMKSTSSFKLLFYLNRLEMINVYASNVLISVSSDLDTIICTDFAVAVAKKLKKSQISLLENFNIEKDIPDMSAYSLVHTKHILLDNFYLILPLINNTPVQLQSVLTSVLNLIFSYNSSTEKELQIDQVNLNALFNDQSLLQQILVAFFNILIACEDDSNTEQADDNHKNQGKFFEKVLDLFNSEFHQESVAAIFESKKLAKVKLNLKQAKVFFEICRYIPIEFLNAKYAVLFYLLNEKVKIEEYSESAEHKDLEKSYFQVYNRLFLTDILECVPIAKLEASLVDLLNLVDLISSAKSIEIFDKIFKKGMNIMTREQNIDILINFINRLFDRVQKEIDEKQMSIINLAFIQTLERICKIQEHASSQNVDYLNKLNNMFERLVNYFISTTSADESEDQGDELNSTSEIRQHSFYICSILMRQMCSLKQQQTPVVSQLAYLSKLLDSCLKFHKRIMKHVSKNTDKPVRISSFYVDFVKSYVLNSAKLNILVATQADPVKFCKDIIKLLARVNKNQNNAIEIDFSFVHRKGYGEPTDIELENEESSDKFDLSNNYLLRMLVTSFNTLNIEQFKLILAHVVVELTQSALSQNYATFLKMTELVKVVSCDLDLNESLKEEFFVFVQKFLVQLPPVYSHMKSSGNFEQMIVLLGHQSMIASSKYYLLPSHLVISTLQVYTSLDYESFEIERYIKFQELAFKTVNTVVTRYSKKFGKLAAVVCNLLMKLISATTALSNQNNLSEEQVSLAVKLAQDLERAVAQLLPFKKDFSKIAPCMISEFLLKANSIPIHLAVKSVLNNAVYNLISICDLHGVSQLHVALPIGPKELFKTTYAEFEKYYKYTGKV